MNKAVYIVHCIDTEGPMNETLEASFERLKEMFDIQLEPTVANMKKIQNKQIDFGNDTDIIADIFAPKRIDMKKNWDEIDDMMRIIRSEEYRNKLKDSAGNGWKYSWFCMDHVGFLGNNPRHRDAGYHNIYDYYKNLLKIENHGDIIQFHYHPLAFCGDYNLQGTSYVANSNIFEILARDIIDRDFFPAAFRPGFHVERPDSHWFLEQWIPFDYGNQAIRGESTVKQKDTLNGRFGNWNHAPAEWYPYHPSHDDYQQKGTCKRYITRCLNMDARHGMLSEQDIKEAFEYADKNGTALLAFTDHDFRDMEQEINNVRELIEKVSSKFPQVSFYFEDAVSGMKKVLDLSEKVEQLELNIQPSIEENQGILKIESNHKIFGTQPFLAIKTVTGQYYWDNLDYSEDENVWFYTLDKHTFFPNMVEKIGVAANDEYGNTATATSVL